MPAAGGRGAYLLGIDATGLVAQKFALDTMSVTGTATLIIAGAATASVSENGVLATSVSGSRPLTIPAWFDRGGTSRGQFGQPGLIEAIALSPNGRKLAIAERGGGTVGVQIWMDDLMSGVRTRATFSEGNNSAPVWSPVAATIAFTSGRDGKELFYFAGQTLMRVPVTLHPTFPAGAPTALFEAPIQPGYSQDSHRWQLSPDGQRFLLLANAGTGQGTPLDVIVNWTALLPK